MKNSKPPRKGTAEYEKLVSKMQTYLKSTKRRRRLYACLASGVKMPSWELREHVWTTPPSQG